MEYPKFVKEFFQDCIDDPEFHYDNPGHESVQNITENKTLTIYLLESLAKDYRNDIAVCKAEGDLTFASTLENDLLTINKLIEALSGILMPVDEGEFYASNLSEGQFTNNTCLFSLSLKGKGYEFEENLEEGTIFRTGGSVEGGIWLALNRARQNDFSNFTQSGNIYRFVPGKIYNAEFYFGDKKYKGKYIFIV